MEALVPISIVDEHASSHLQVESAQAVPSESVNSHQSTWLFRRALPLSLACLALILLSGLAVRPLCAHGKTPSGSASHSPHMQTFAFNPTLSLLRPGMMPQPRDAFARPSLRQGGKATYRQAQVGSSMMAPSDDPSKDGPSGPAGNVAGYMSRIPPHLQGMAIRNQKRETRDYSSRPMTETEKIQKELDQEDEEDEFDYAMSTVEDVKVSAAGRTMDFNDAQVMHGLHNAMHPDDFQKVFGKLGDLL